MAPAYEHLKTPASPRVPTYVRSHFQPTHRSRLIAPLSSCAFTRV